MELQTVGVVGAGTMGAGIAQVFAQAGREVVLVDSADLQLARGQQLVRDSLARLEKKGSLTAAQTKLIQERIRPTTRVGEVKACPLVIEAVFEDLAVKKSVFAEIDKVAREDAILASNTSSISITALAAATRRPASVIGMHFMNPVPVMKLVELICGLETSDTTYERARDAVLLLGKQPVQVRDFPGFVSNRILMPMLNEAIFCVMEGVASKEAIDDIMKLGMSHPMGPLQLADLIGLDVCLAILSVLHHDLGEDKYRPCPLLRKMVEAGQLGKKSGRGFYDYR